MPPGGSRCTAAQEEAASAPRRSCSPRAAITSTHGGEQPPCDWSSRASRRLPWIAAGMPAAAWCRQDRHGARRANWNAGRSRSTRYEIRCILKKSFVPVQRSINTLTSSHIPHPPTSALRRHPSRSEGAIPSLFLYALFRVFARSAWEVLGLMRGRFAAGAGTSAAASTGMAAAP